MYIPKYNEMTDKREIADFIHQHSFGMLMSDVNGKPFGTHLPFLYNPEQAVLMAHMAKANPQWRALEGQTVLAVFTGPHAYISPTWYNQPASVPTWNYVAAHVYGTCHLITDPQEMKRLLAATVRFYEPSSILPEQEDDPFYQALMQAIVGFRIDISSIEGKAKLSQNKSADVRARVVKALQKSEAPEARAVAALMADR